MGVARLTSLREASDWSWMILHEKPVAIYLKSTSDVTLRCRTQIPKTLSEVIHSWPPVQYTESDEHPPQAPHSLGVLEGCAVYHQLYSMPPVGCANTRSFLPGTLRGLSSPAALCNKRSFLPGRLRGLTPCSCSIDSYFPLYHFSLSLLSVGACLSG